MSSHRRCWALATFVLLATAVTVSAQTDPATWRRGTTLNLFAGMAGASSDLAPLAGGAFGWEVTPWFGIEASGAWLTWGHEAGGFDAALRALMPVHPSRTVDPFLSAGVGMHRAWFQTADPEMPEFYRRRIDPTLEPSPVSTTFTDPSLIFGGGVSVFVTRKLSIRPEVDATIAIHDARTYTTAMARVHFAYHFEDHPITSERAVAPRD